MAMTLALAAPPTRSYRRRRPERGVLHAVVREHLETFLAERRAADPDGEGVPRFVERSLRAFLRCGILAHGFARFRCDACRAERLVAFSCKGRGLCPSCDGRRMTERAADLVDRVLPRVPYRQWVLSLPFWLRWRCGFDHELTLAIARVHCRAVFGWIRRRAGRSGTRTGAVTVVQRFGGALNLNVHFHTLVPDGAWTEMPDGSLCFHRVPAPTPDELDALRDRIARRVERLLVRRGLWLHDDEGGRPAEGEPLPPLADLYQDSTVGKHARRLGVRMPLKPGTQLGRARSGFDLHAGVAIRARDRDALERLCRYLLRPSVATERLERLPNGDVLVRLKAPWSDGTTHVGLSPRKLLERLAVLVPRPQTNAILYHGVFAANAKWRPRLVPASPPARRTCDHPTDPARPAAVTASGESTTTHERPSRSADDPVIVPASAHRPLAPHRPNHTWAELMRRGLSIDSLDCPTACGGRLRLLALIDQPAVARRILEHLGHDAAPVSPAPARAPPSSDELDWGA